MTPTQTRLQTLVASQLGIDDPGKIGAESSFKEDLGADSIDIVETACEACCGAGEIYTHSDTCDDDSCALAGGLYDCAGQVAPCATCSTGDDE